MLQPTQASDAYALLDRMVATLQASEAVKRKATYDDVSLGIIVSDLDVDYSVRMVKGQVSGGPDGAGGCTISITLTMANLDRILTGQIDPESAYMSGLLSLRGSEYLAQSLLRYVPDLVAAYREAKSAA